MLCESDYGTTSELKTEAMMFCRFCDGESRRMSEAIVKLNDGIRSDETGKRRKRGW